MESGISRNDAHLEPIKPRLLVSVSGGKTSGYMAYVINKKYQDQYEIVNVFANTGQENEETLVFLSKLDLEFNLNIVWLEAQVFFGERRGTKHNVVSFDKASRMGEPFKDVIHKYGIPNTSYPHCTRELKLRPIHSYVRELWGSKDYLTAIGIRTDEARRVAKSSPYNIVYPLIDWFPADKIDVNDWWEEQNFNLELEEHQGNCKTCWKKSDTKILRLIGENPEQFRFFSEMEDRYSNEVADGYEPRVFFRSERSTKDMLKLHEVTSASPHRKYPNISDEDGGCSESCELYPTEIPNN